MDQKQLREQENRCIQEQAPACTAACPAHVDVRGMAAEISRGDFAAAYKLYRKAVPFPGIISRICDQPCQLACLRKELGGAIEIAALERACLDYGSQGEEPIKALPRKSKTMAVIGAGISGLTVAYELARKGWGVVVYEASDRIGGGLWEIPADTLPRELLQKDLQVFDELEVEFRLNTTVGRTGGNGHRTFLARLCDEYAAVYLGIGHHSSDVPDLKLNDSGHIEIDPLTFQTSLATVFAGGEVLRAQVNFPDHAEPKHSAILSISEGRRAAVSIDRLLQKVSLTAARSNEGPYTSRLYTNISAIPALAPAEKADSATLYKPKAAIAEAQRCIQCECMECVKTCEYLKEYGGYPKKYIREVYNNLSIVMGTRHSNHFINSCALCGLCAEICPTDVDMGAICREARVQMVEQKRMPASAHDFALRDMEFSNSENFALARSQPGMDTCEYVFFPGCQLSASAPQYVEKAYAFLTSAYQEMGVGVGLMLRCCGAPADWAGQTDLFKKSQSEFLAEYEKLGRPKVILACSSCYQVFNTHYPDIEILSFWDVYDRHTEPRPSLERNPVGTVTIHDPCSTRYEIHIQDSIRNILYKAGYLVQELELSREKTECCSYGGLMWLANRPLSEKVIQRRVEESPLDYLTYCTMCRDLFVRAGKPTLHILDIIFEPGNHELASRLGPGYSQRHENRARLKKKMLKEVWREEMSAEEQAYESIPIYLSEDVQKRMEDRLILVEDIQKVIEYAERTGKRFINPATQHYLAYAKPTSVTYWVEYSPEKGGFLIHNAYSHRMEIGSGAKK